MYTAQESEAIGEATSQLLDMLLEIMKETEPEEYIALMKWNDKLREERLAREEKDQNS